MIGRLFQNMLGEVEGIFRNLQRAVEGLTTKGTRAEELEQTREELERVSRQLERVNGELEHQRALVARSARLAAMGEMAAGIAHEINNPLTTIKNLVHSFGGGQPNDELQRKDISIIKEEIDRINKLVQNFIGYAQLPEAKVIPLDLRVVVVKTLELLEPQIKQKQIQVQVDLEEGGPLVKADREQIGQVCLNLLLNAIQVSTDGGAIRVYSRTRHKDGTQEPDLVELGVTDQGPGIRPQDRDQVFKPFFTTKSKGSGLGLAISQRIIEEHDGSISFHDGPVGKGTTFVVSLKVERGAACA